MTESEIQSLMEAIAEGVGNGVGPKIVDAGMTALAVLLAVSRQPSIDKDRLIADFESFLGGPEGASRNAFAHTVLQLLREQDSTTDS